LRLLSEFTRIDASKANTAVPTPAIESRVEPSGALRETQPPRLEQAAARTRADVDARQCLEFATNSEVHRCAERYRSRTAQAGSKSAQK
jgi:hypothetical protein